MAGSEIADFRRKQALQEQAAQQGLYGLAAGVSRHDVIEARAQRGAATILNLLEAGHYEQAFQLWSSPTWGENELDQERHA